VLPDRLVQLELIQQQLVQRVELVQLVLQVLVPLDRLVDRVFKAYKAQLVILGLLAQPEQQV
jgi:hypothetical protein